MSALTHLFCAAPVEQDAEDPIVPSTFSIGLTPLRQRVRDPRRRENRREVRRNAVERRRFIPPFLGTVRPLYKPVEYDFKFTPFKRWLLTDRGIPLPIVMFLETAGTTFPQIYMTIITKKQRQQKFFSQYNSYTTSEPPIPVLAMYKEAAIKNQKLIRSFRSLAQRWMRSKITVKNTEDLVTGDAPLIPVRLVDWRTRSIYVFEARTIARDIITRLTLSHCDFFPWPKIPRNPYTNEPLTEGQFYSVAKQLKAAGETHWSIEALYTAKYKITEFERDMYSKLKRTIHNSVFANPCGDVAKRILLEYIEEEHKEHKMFYEAEIYEWAVENLAHHYSVHKWRIQCTKYYTMIHFPSDKAKDDEEKEKIDAATKRLCAYPAPLVERYNAVHEKKYVKLEDRVAIAAGNAQYQFVGAINVIDMAAILAAYEESSDDSESEAGSGDEDNSATQPE